MNAQILIDSIVRQVTVLIAQLATSGGIRAPLSHVANQVFLDLARELEAQGVSRKVSADMFGMALRAYIRKVRRLSDSESDKGRTLWQAVLELVEQEGLVGRGRVQERFAADGELQVTAVLHDLTESGLLLLLRSRLLSASRRAAARSSQHRQRARRCLSALSQSGLDRGAGTAQRLLVMRRGLRRPS